MRTEQPQKQQNRSTDSRSRSTQAGALDDKDLEKVTGGAAAPNLFQSCVSGKHIPKGTIQT